jgi:hypothetical protein
MHGTLDAPAPAPVPVPVPAPAPATVIPVAEPEQAALTVTIPQLPSALSSGVGLFAPLSDEDEVPAALADGGGEAAEPPEVTPIFDTLSVWFEESPAADADADAEPADAGDGWRFAADEGWQAVDAVVDTQPEEFTSAGLPKRQPQALLLPGSVQSDGLPRHASGVPAERLRHRLSGFQDGLRRGRRAAAAADSDTADTVRTGPLDSPVEDWASLADDGQRAADGVAAATTGETTLVGLPKRRPREHLLPGSVAPPADRHAAPTRDAGVMRARLSSFQRGVREGRGGTEPVAAEPAEHGFHW